MVLSVSVSNLKSHQLGRQCWPGSPLSSRDISAKIAVSRSPYSQTCLMKGIGGGGGGNDRIRSLRGCPSPSCLYQQRGALPLFTLRQALAPTQPNSPDAHVPCIPSGQLSARPPSSVPTLNPPLCPSLGEAVRLPQFQASISILPSLGVPRADGPVTIPLLIPSPRRPHHVASLT